MTTFSNLYPTDPHAPVEDRLYTTDEANSRDGLYDPSADALGDRWTSVFVPPAITAPRGVLDVVNWLQDGTTPLRFLDGMVMRQANFDLEQQFGVWGEDWCASPDDTKEKARPDAVFSEIEPITVYAYDQNQCGDLTAASRNEVRQRAQQIMALNEQTAVERSLSERLLSDATTSVTAASVTEAVSIIETEMAKTGLTGYIHASPKWAAYLAESRLSLGGRSPLGHTWVFGGGYADTLGDTLVATTGLYGWRGPVSVRDAIKTELNQYVVVVERSMLIAYEAAVVAVQIAG